MEIIKKRSASKQRLAAQSCKNSKTGAEEINEDVLRVWMNINSQIIEKIRGVVGLPKQGEQLRFVSCRKFSPLAIFDIIMESEKIIESYICVFSINHDTGLIIDKLAAEGKLGKCTFVISNLRNSSFKDKFQVVKQLFINNKNIKLIFCGIHAKIMCFRTEKNYYVIETSANFSYNSRIEQYLFENSMETYCFHKRWIDDIDNMVTEKEITVYD